MGDAQLIAGVGDHAVEPHGLAAGARRPRLGEREQLAEGRGEPPRLLLDDARRLARLREVAALGRARDDAGVALQRRNGRLELV